MANRALAFGFGGYADLDLTFGEFFHGNHTVAVRFMPQHPYAGPGPMVAENGSGTYLIGQADYRSGSGDAGQIGPSTLFVQAGSAKVLYEVPHFSNGPGGPSGYRGVWQHLAVVRQGDTIHLYLNGDLLQPFGTAALTVPASGLPSSSTPIRLGRRSPGNDVSNLFWQFYGLLDDVAVYTRALSADDIKQAAAATTLTGLESGLLAGWTFDTDRRPPPLARSVSLPEAADIPEYVNEHVSRPVPVYFVDVSADRDSSADRRRMDVRPSKVRATLPFSAGEWWKVTQGREDPGSSHNGGIAAFCTDFVRVNGETRGSTILAAAAARVIFADDTAGKEAMSVYHAALERAVYMHLETGFFSKYFPNFEGRPQDVAVGDQPTVDLGDPIAEVGKHPSPNNDHLHFVVSTITGKTFAGAGPSLPGAVADYFVSTDRGRTWSGITYGVPVPGDWVSRYPWTGAFAALLGPGRGPRIGAQRFLAGLDFDEFVRAWVAFGTAHRVYDMETFDTYVEGGRRRFAGVFGPGKGGQHFIAGLEFQPFVDKWIELGTTTPKADMIAFRAFRDRGASLRFAGLFGPGQGGQHFIAGLEFQPFVDKWVELGSGTPKADMLAFDTYLEDGKRYFAGLFGPGTGGQHFLAGLEFQPFVDKWVELGSQSPRKDLIAFRMYGERGTTYFAGLFGPGQGGQAFNTGLGFDTVVSMQAKANRQGRRLIHVVAG